MTLTAELYIGDVLYKTLALKEFREQIILAGAPRMSMSVFNPELMTQPLQYSEMIFDYERTTGYRTLRYNFTTATGTTVAEQNHELFFEFEPDEPDENVNLDKLKSKLRSREDMTKLLLQYYRS